MKHDLARELRHRQTDLERKLWYILRDRRFHTQKFRRQQPRGPYVVDFVCFERRLVIELDGSQHAQPQNKAIDANRTAFLESRGFRVVRFWNPDFRKNKEGVLETIRIALEETPHPARLAPRHPLPHGERETHVDTGQPDDDGHLLPLREKVARPA
ncbi:MAG TPA: DUF559 domain-containing protein [Rhizomicrobium sp.]|nr:DUF559 domain-containing protein [Rhizomicrobium sp.]